MSKHTPGPWRVQGENIGPIDTSDTQAYGMITPVAKVDRWDYPDEWQANARLLAASPEMFRILKKIVEAEQERHGYVPAWLDEAQAVIKQVEGETG
jgi:hypothetical protein